MRNTERRHTERADARWPYIAVSVALLGVSALLPGIWNQRRGGAHIEDTPRGAAMLTVTPVARRSVGAPLVQPREPQDANVEETRLATAEPTPAVLADPIVGDVGDHAAPTLAPTEPPVAHRIESPREPSVPPSVERSLLPKLPPPADEEKSLVVAPTPVAWLQLDALVATLDALQRHTATARWADDVLVEVRQLQTIDPAQTDRLAAIAHRLHQLSEIAGVLATRIPDAGVSGDLMRARYALSRRIDLWTAAAPLFPSGAVARATDSPAVANLDPSSAVQEHLQNRADRELNVATLLGEIERYEETRSPELARRLVAYQRQLAALEQPASRDLARQLEAHYRNANVRVAVTGELLNRLMSQPNATEDGVDDTVQGLPVYGRRWTATKLFVRLLPDERRVRLGLEAHGDVVSETSATAGPATFYNSGQSRFLARKLVILDGHRLRQWPAVAEADAETSLRGVRTDFDFLPLVGPLVQSIARNKHDAQKYLARDEVREKVSQQASAELDSQSAPGLTKLHQNLTEKVVAPLEKLGLSPTPISQSTDEKRFVVRYRLAGTEQFGGHTARPQAPGDSLFSVQVHESAINNMLANLGLAGQSHDVRELYALMATRLGHADAKVPDEIPENVTVTFADHDPITVRFAESRVQVTLRIKELEAEHKRWRKLTVVANYEPHVNGLSANLARAGGVEVDGDRLAPRSQIALRAIFSNMFARNRHAHLVPEKLVKDARLANLRVSQVETADGWLGLAIGPQHAGAAAGSDQARREKAQSR